MSGLRSETDKQTKPDYDRNAATVIPTPTVIAQAAALRGELLDALANPVEN